MSLGKELLQDGIMFLSSDMSTSKGESGVELSSLYGNMGYQVFKQGSQNWKYFWLKINIP